MSAERLRELIAQRLRDVAHFNGCVGHDDRPCEEAQPDDPLLWCKYCVQGRAAILLEETPKSALGDTGRATPALRCKDSVLMNACTDERAQCTLPSGHEGHHTVSFAALWTTPAALPQEFDSASIIAKLSDELGAARETIRRLNRRCQLADAAVQTKVEKFMQRGTPGLRNYYFQRNQELEAELAAVRAHSGEGRAVSLEEQDASLERASQLHAHGYAMGKQMMREDIAQIIEGIEHFCIGPIENAECRAIWQPYIDKLHALAAPPGSGDGPPQGNDQ